MDHQTKIDHVSSNLPDVIQKLEKVLNQLKSVVAQDDQDSNLRKWQLHQLSNPINDPAVLDLLHKISVKRRSSIDFHHTSYPTLGTASSASLLVQPPQGSPAPGDRV